MIYVLAGVMALVAITLIAIRRGPANCGKCGGKLPMFRLPGTAEHARSGGWTCPHCGVDLDRDGNLMG